MQGRRRRDDVVDEGEEDTHTSVWKEKSEDLLLVPLSVITMRLLLRRIVK